MKRVRWKKLATRRLFHVWLLAMLSLGLFANLIIYVGGSPVWNITEDANFITVENDYYIAKVEKARGRLYNFYIKPNTIVDIVTSWTGHSLGGHEYESYNGSSGESAGSSQWSALGFTLYETSIVAQTNDYVTVFTKFMLNDTDSVYPSAVNISEWKTFYADKPYMLVTFNREYLYDHNFLYEQQTCFLFDPVWVEGMKATNNTGHIVDGTTLGAEQDGYSWFVKGINKFPWWYAYNTTYGKGFGTILISSYPTPARIGYYFLSANDYVEYQITQNSYTSGMKANTENSVTYINYVASNESEIDTFSQNLYKSMLAQNNASLYVGANNYEHSTYGGFIKPYGIKWQYGSTLWKAYPYIIGDSNGNNYEPRYRNATSDYALVTSWTNMEYPYFYWNNTYTKITVRTDFENKLLWEETVEAWADSDVVKVFYNVTTLATVNVTDLYLRFREMYPYDNSDIIQLSTNIIKMNASTAFTDWIVDNGLAIKNMSGTTEISGVYMNFYLLNRATDQQFSAGTKWNMTLHYQTFLRLDRYFTTSDFLDLHESEIMQHIGYNAYIPLPFPDFPTTTNATVFVRYIGRATHQVAYSTFANDVLTLHIVGSTGKTSTTKVYTGSKGKPTSVSGASSWTYDSTSKILTITATHSSPATITIDWTTSSSSGSTSSTQINYDQLIYQLFYITIILGTILVILKLITKAFK